MSDTAILILIKYDIFWHILQLDKSNALANVRQSA